MKKILINVTDTRTFAGKIEAIKEGYVNRLFFQVS
jgi:hypothetical protein